MSGGRECYPGAACPDYVHRNRARPAPAGKPCRGPAHRALGLLVAFAVVSPAANAAAADTYPLDGMSRQVSPKGKLQCPKVDKVWYKGDVVRYRAPVYVFKGFAERLERFEEVVRDLAVEIYGRAPRVISHMGTYNCRRIRRYRDWLSEHAFGNAIDIAGFDFGPLPKKRRATSNLPASLKRSFKVRLLNHWTGTRGAAGIHSRFLNELARRLVTRKDIFRVLLGPAYPGHKNHFHLDCAPWRMVDIW